MAISERVLILRQQWLDESRAVNRAFETVNLHINHLNEINSELWNLCKAEGIDMSELLTGKKDDQHISRNKQKIPRKARNKDSVG